MLPNVSNNLLVRHPEQATSNVDTHVCSGIDACAACVGVVPPHHPPQRPAPAVSTPWLDDGPNSCVALITARAGSKGLPGESPSRLAESHPQPPGSASGKNIIELAGIPLIAHAILVPATTYAAPACEYWFCARHQAARGAHHISRVIVSTDGEQIAQVSSPTNTSTGS